MKHSACPVCGHEPALPTITPEMLYFRSIHQDQPKKGAVMPDGSFAVAFNNVIYAMPPADWESYLVMRQSAAVMDDRLTQDAA